MRSHTRARQPRAVPVLARPGLLGLDDGRQADVAKRRIDVGAFLHPHAARHRYPELSGQHEGARLAHRDPQCRLARQRERGMALDLRSAGAQGVDRAVVSGHDQPRLPRVGHLEHGVDEAVGLGGEVRHNGARAAPTRAGARRPVGVGLTGDDADPQARAVVRPQAGQSLPVVAVQQEDVDPRSVVIDVNSQLSRRPAVVSPATHFARRGQRRRAAMRLPCRTSVDVSQPADLPATDASVGGRRILAGRGPRTL